MILLKSQLPQTSKQPVFHVFDEAENELHSWRHYKHFATKFMEKIIEPVDPRSQRFYKHRFVKYIIHDRTLNEPSHFKNTNSFVFTGKQVDLPKAFHYVPIAHKEEMVQPYSLNDLSTLAASHGACIGTPNNPQALIDEFQIIDTFFKLAKPEKRTVFKYYEAHAIEDMLVAFSVYHLHAVNNLKYSHFDIDLIFLAARKHGLQLGMDTNKRPYWNKTQNRRLNGLIKLPISLPGTVINYTKPWPTRFFVHHAKTFQQNIIPYDEASMKGEGNA